MRKAFSLVALAASFAMPLQGVHPADLSPFSGLRRQENPHGFIFSVSNILLDIDGYQGGIGAKLWMNNIGLRGVLGFSHSSAAQKTGATLGVAAEMHVMPAEVVSPFWGCFLDLGFDMEKAVADSDNHTNATSCSIATGIMLGGELAVLPFLSLFAEYRIVLRVIGTSMVQTVAGSSNESHTWNYEVATGIGNNGQLGLVLYLPGGKK